MSLILLVDDEPSILLAMGDALQRAGYEVVRAKNGREALQQCERRVFDVVVTDVHMPEMDGIVLLRKLHAIAPNTDVLLMTAFGSVSDVVAAFRLGAEDYLTKPFEAARLVERVGALVERRKLLQD